MAIGKIPPFIPPDASKGPQKISGEKEDRRQPAKADRGEIREPALDARGIAVRLAALATEAKRKELSMAKIIEQAIEETGITNPQAALEEVNKRLQKEIEAVLDEIKSNKELMEEAEAWTALGDLLESNLSQDQLQAFIDLVESQIKEMRNPL